MKKEKLQEIYGKLSKLEKIVKEYIEDNSRTSKEAKIKLNNLKAILYIETVSPITVDMDISFKLSYNKEKLLQDFGNIDRIKKIENDIKSRRNTEWNIHKNNLRNLKNKKTVDGVPNIKDTMEPIQLQKEKEKYDKDTEELIKKETSRIDIKKVLFDDFFYDVLSKNLSDRNLLIKVKKISIPNFTAKYCISASDNSLYSLDPNKSSIPAYTLTFNFEAVDHKKEITKDEIVKIFTKVLKEIEDRVLTDTEYYSIKGV